MKQIFTLYLNFILILVFNIQTLQGQVEWKYSKYNQTSNDESFLGLVSAQELSNGKTICGGINVEDETYMYPYLTILDENGRLILDSIFEKAEQGIFYVQEASDSTFITLSNSIDRVRVLKTTYDLKFNKLSEDLILSNSNVLAFGFSYKKSLLSNGNTLITTDVAGGFLGLLFIIIDSKGNIVNEDILRTDGYHNTIIESFIDKKYYVIGESVIELDSNFLLGNTLVEDLVSDIEFYGFGAVKFNDQYVVTNMDNNEGSKLQVFDSDFNLVKTILEPDTSDENYFSGIIFNPTLSLSDSFLLTGYSEYYDDFTRTFLRKYDRNYEVVWETVLLDSTFAFEITNLSSNADGSILITLYGKDITVDNDVIHTGVIKMGRNGVISKTSDYGNSTESYTIYPNPSEGTFNIITSSSNELSTITFYAADGSIRHASKLSNSSLSELDLKELPAGQYVYKISSKQQIIKTGSWIKI